MNDVVNHPSHYTKGKVECIEALAAATEGLTGIEAVCTANAIKYAWRWKWKNGVEDIDKAIWYLTKLKETIESASTPTAAKTPECVTQDMRGQQLSILDCAHLVNEVELHVGSRERLMLLCNPKVKARLFREAVLNGYPIRHVTRCLWRSNMESVWTPVGEVIVEVLNELPDNEVGVYECVEGSRGVAQRRGKIANFKI